MKRTGFARHAKEARGPGLAQRIAQSMGQALRHQRAEPAVYRSRKHRQNVAALACVCCGRPGPTQAAHLNLLALGKGRGLKVSDALTVPLCPPRLLQPGCHWRLDQSGDYDKAASAVLQLTWLGQTRTRLLALGQWPEAAESDFQRLVVAYLERAA